MSHFDVIIIGGGPGGYLAAERLGHAGKSVLLAEKQFVGGTCLNVGCIPTKSLLNSAKLYHHASHSEQYGVTAAQVSYDWDTVQAWKTTTVNTLVGGVTTALKRVKVTVVAATAQLVGAGRVAVGDETHTSDHVIVATGSVPVMPPIPGSADNPQLVDSTGLLAIAEVPQRLVVIGGGVIGVEFASLFSALGTKVSVIEMMPEILPFTDPSSAAVVRTALTDVDFHLNSKVTSLDGGRVSYTDSDGQSQTVIGDVVLMAVGRRALVDGWGATEAGLDIDTRGVVVDDRMRTNLPNVWAVGDVTGRSLLAHAAYRMAEVAVANILDPHAHRHGEQMRWNTIPWAVYSMPEAAGVGLTEAAAASGGYDTVSVTVPLVMSGRFVAENGLSKAGTVTLLAERGTGLILGITMVGPYAPETIWGAAAVLENEFTVTDLRQVVFPHPTVSEGIREAAWALAI